MDGATDRNSAGSTRCRHPSTRPRSTRQRRSISMSGGAVVARIRSVHPDLFLDEAFVSLKIATRVFLIGLWTECDDHGAFEWQPSRLRFKILPAEGIAGDALLGELEQANIIKKVDIDGRAYGLVRNFCRFQRPKKPTYKVDIPVEHRS